MKLKTRLTLAMLIAMGMALAPTSSLSLATVFDDQSAWLPEVEELFVADTYCTPESAARALAHVLTREIRARLGTERLGTERPCALTVDVTAGQPALSGEPARRAFIESVQMDKLVHVLDPASDVDAVVVVLTIGTDQVDDDPTAGTLQLTCELPGEPFVTSARFVRKPWVESVQHAVQRTADQELISVRGLAEQPGIDASRDVIHKVVNEELLPRVLERTNQRFPSKSNWAKRFVRERLVRDIVDNPIVADRFQQTFHKSMEGEDHVVMVREAVLLDVSDGNIAQLADPLVQKLKRVRERRLGALALGGGGILVSLAVGLIGYNVINSFTRGYYAWRLRAATATFWLVSMTLAARMASAMFSTL